MFDSSLWSWYRTPESYTKGFHLGKKTFHFVWTPLGIWIALDGHVSLFHVSRCDGTWSSPVDKLPFFAHVHPEYCISHERIPSHIHPHNTYSLIRPFKSKFQPSLLKCCGWLIDVHKDSLLNQERHLVCSPSLRLWLLIRFQERDLNLTTKDLNSPIPSSCLLNKRQHNSISGWSALEYPKLCGGRDGSDRMNGIRKRWMSYNLCSEMCSAIPL